MTSLKALLLSAVALGVVVATPTTAHAITVQCTLKDGSSCTVSNDPVDSVSCMCSDDAGTGSSGADDWADFDETMLLEVCTAELEFCSLAGTDGATTGMGTIGTDSADTGDDSTTGGSSSGGVDPTTGGSSSGGTGDESSTGGKSTGSGPSTDPADTTGSSASGGDGDPASTSGSEPAPSGESSGGASETDEDPSGCNVSPRGRDGALLALFGLALGFRRRRTR